MVIPVTEDAVEIAAPPKNHLVILVHGMRDIARWKSEVAVPLRKAGFAVEPTNYGRMNLIEFLLPISYFRQKAIDDVWIQIQHALRLHPGKRVSIIAHSFGTYIVASLLRRQFNLQLCRVIFCGSVVQSKFPFEQIDDRYEGSIVNEVGTADPWPALAESVTTGYGSAGTYGFERPGVRDRYYNGAGHGYFLNAKFCEDRWVKVLERKDKENVEDGDVPAEIPPLWVRLISIFKIKYILAAAMALALAMFVMRLIIPPPPPPPLPQVGFEIFNHDRVVDLSDWKPVPEEALSVPTSKTVWHDRYKLKRLRDDIRTFVMRRAVTGEVKPEFASSTHRYTVRDASERPLIQWRPIPRLYDVLIDVSNEPVGEWFDVRVDSVYWNVFLTPETWWIGIPVQFPTQSIRLEVRSSSKTFGSFQRAAYPRSETPENHLVNEPTAEKSADGHSIVWNIAKPSQNWIYRLAWEW
ncbi:hypothetical protein [Bradyrhizobium sp. 62B]|uniref:hypothetical protein n=1 Tax=Bradyrhizobium sp. 62B TaxID=2898442 RepID=UPI002557CFDB